MLATAIGLLFLAPVVDRLAFGIPFPDPLATLAVGLERARL